MHYPNSGMENDMETAMGHKKGVCRGMERQSKMPIVSGVWALRLRASGLEHKGKLGVRDYGDSNCHPLRPMPQKLHPKPSTLNPRNCTLNLGKARRNLRPGPKTLQQDCWETESPTTRELSS